MLHPAHTRNWQDYIFHDVEMLAVACVRRGIDWQRSRAIAPEIKFCFAWFHRNNRAGIAEGSD